MFTTKKLFFMALIGLLVLPSASSALWQITTVGNESDDFMYTV